MGPASKGEGEGQGVTQEAAEQETSTIRGCPKGYADGVQRLLGARS